MVAHSRKENGQQELSVFFVEENERYRLTFKTDPTQVLCFVHIDILTLDSLQQCSNLPETDSDKNDNVPTASVQTMLPQLELICFLNENCTAATIDSVAVAEFCAILERGVIPEQTILARGISPQNGEDGWLELLIKTFGAEIDLHEDALGRVDHKALNTYTPIEPEKKLARIHAPQKGIPGMTIHGEAIPAQDGKPITLNAGAGVELRYDQRVAFATTAGYAVLNGKNLSVVNKLEIPGNVDLTIGDINFSGLVEVKGELPDDFDIKATTGVKIHGAAGACQIESDGPVEIGSMAGKGIGIIICHGSLRSNFLNQVTVTCYGDVIITSEIRNCQIKATGRIVVERGGIIGGSCYALSGIEAQTIGATSGQATLITSGVYFPDVDRFTYLNKRKSHISDQIQAINTAIKPLHNLTMQSSNIATVASKRLEILQEQLEKLIIEKRENLAELNTSTPQVVEGCNAKINVKNTLLEGVKIHLGNVCEEINSNHRGPISITENTLDGGLNYQPLSPLSLPSEETDFA